MKQHIYTQTYSSFLVFADRFLLTEAEAYTNHSGSLYQVQDRTFVNNSIYSSPFSQWVYDSSVSGAYIPTGIYNNDQFITKNTSGLKIDYLNGRAIFNNGVILSNPTINYAIKDFNWYLTSKSEEELIFNNAYKLKSQIMRNPVGSESDKKYAPCIFVRRTVAHKEPLAFGGLNNDMLQIRTIILAENEYQLENCVGFLHDLYGQTFKVLPSAPLNIYGDFRSGNYYNYIENLTNIEDNYNLCYINGVNYSRFSPQAEVEIDNNMAIGFINFSVELPRY